MNIKKAVKLLAVLSKIQVDMQNDTAEFDKQKLTKETVAVHCAKQGAAIAALANLISSVIMEQ